MTGSIDNGEPKRRCDSVGGDMVVVGDLVLVEGTDRRVEWREVLGIERGLLNAAGNRVVVFRTATGSMVWPVDQRIAVQRQEPFHA